MTKNRNHSGAAPASDLIRVLIVDDHPVVRDGIRSTLESEGGFMVCAEAADTATALSAFERARPDMAIVDLNLKGRSGFDLIRQIQARRPGFPILVLSVSDDTSHAERALKAGARGYLTKQDAPGLIADSIRSVLKGEIVLSQQMETPLLERLLSPAGRSATGEPADLLSDREMEILTLIGKGFKTGRIAQTLRISTNTVQTHRASMKRKLGLTTSAELARYATRRNHTLPE